MYVCSKGEARIHKVEGRELEIETRCAHVIAVECGAQHSIPTSVIVRSLANSLFTAAQDCQSCQRS